MGQHNIEALTNKCFDITTCCEKTNQHDKTLLECKVLSE